MELPVELQAFILTKLDGASLARAKAVCSLWNDAVHKLETLGNMWMVCCYREILPEIICELAECHELSELSLNPWHYWRDMYAQYHRGGFVKKCCSWKFQSLDIPNTDFHTVTCLKLFNEDLLIGFRSGIVCLCKGAGNSSPQLSLLLHHGRQVTKLSMVKPKESRPLFVSVSGGHDIQVCSPGGDFVKQLNYHSKPITSASSWGEWFVTCASDCMLHGQPVWRVHADCTVTRQVVLKGHLSERITHTAMWDNKVATGDDKGNVLLWEIDQPHSPTLLGSFSSKIRWIELRGSLLLWLTASGVLYVSRDCKTYIGRDVCKALHGKPETVTLRGPLLAIGTKSGFVHLYHVPSHTAWCDLDLQNPDSTIKCDADHVNAIEIGDDGTGPMVVMATDRGITLVRWETFAGHQEKREKTAQSVLELPEQIVM